MSEARRFFQRVYHLFRPGPAESQLDREVSAHLALLEDEFLRQGMSVDEARLAALEPTRPR